jgi:hypothetical protein
MCNYIVSTRDYFDNKTLFEPESFRSVGIDDKYLIHISSEKMSIITADFVPLNKINKKIEQGGCTHLIRMKILQSNSHNPKDIAFIVKFFDLYHPKTILLFNINFNSDVYLKQAPERTLAWINHIYEEAEKWDQE